MWAIFTVSSLSRRQHRDDHETGSKARGMNARHHYLGYEPSEIAETLGIPPGTARSRLHHAHRAMRAALEADARSTVKEGRSA